MTGNKSSIYVCEPEKKARLIVWVFQFKEKPHKWCGGMFLLKNLSYYGKCDPEFSVVYDHLFARNF